MGSARTFKTSCTLSSCHLSSSTTRALGYFLPDTVHHVACQLSAELQFRSADNCLGTDMKCICGLIQITKPTFSFSSIASSHSKEVELNGHMERNTLSLLEGPHQIRDEAYCQDYIDNLHCCCLCSVLWTN